MCLPPSAGGSDGHICGSWEAEVGPACAALPCVCVCVAGVGGTRASSTSPRARQICRFLWWSGGHSHTALGQEPVS